MSWLFIVLICLSLDYSKACSRTPTRPPIKSCTNHKDCISCGTKDCFWCTKTSKCQTKGSECSKALKITNPSQCDSEIYGKYDKNLAYKMTLLSSLAYSKDVATYLPKAKEVNTFNLVKQIEKPCCGNAYCSGFVAVSHSEKSIAIAFRGSQTIQQQLVQAWSVLTQERQSFEAGGKVVKYFTDAFQILWNDLENDVYEQIKKNPSYKILVTGHSLGGVLASLASTIIAFKKKTAEDNLMLYTFGQPRIGNHEYALSHDKLVPISFRVTHYRDIVVHLPPCYIKPDGACAPVGDWPYHHSKEIFYGADMKTKDSLYKTCLGLPYHEDKSCNNDPEVRKGCLFELIKCIQDHNNYFGISVPGWWKDMK